jgi:hypothetical protein
MQRRTGPVHGIVYPPQSWAWLYQSLHKPQPFVEGQAQAASSVFFNAASPRAAAMALAKSAVTTESYVRRWIVGRKYPLKMGLNGHCA